ncbi:DNA sulfur modification protein DndC [Cupriavidus metallidurans]|uniref:phosphoadenosine phosphosulfate reductase domain-containing protein n=1 Tax=Cupriavidus TaxID=106589 RepID=UPI000496EB7E|nr:MULTISPECIES: phosphoadenosine phosphosulfate reductase family protein [Cupriavidus]MCA3184081.1 phosphoadenosine phosphosulfate reductase family protein [Cupriavidus sp.]MCA3193945.1 phosphoadenosine phosphosulfate reductase family protein [Cupriavidus sp.]MCA3198374.1 phosphoadenosine phosphosulfate reductase family protein [Cupriavidus sp.]MDE4922877.1 phosphoadenosine phosphosulfate reductase family protein [Cupriavidus metallidurans]
METISLFPQGAFEPIEKKIDNALAIITALLHARHPIVVAFSGGKDSSVVAALVLHAAMLYRAAGGTPIIVATTGDTLVESPEVSHHYRAELRRMHQYGRDHDFKVIVKVVQPSMAATFQLKVLSGRALPSFPGTHGDCSTDLKISPQRAFRRKLFRDLAAKGLPPPVTCLGTRYDESARRAAAMRSRGESDHAAMQNKDGDWVVSPIARWSDDDVWEAVALYGSGALPGFSDFEEMRRIYAHSVGTSCAVVADAILDGAARKQGRCGARLGCHVCQMAEDKSLANMIAFDERYAYARGLHRLNCFIRATRHDWERRHWIGRTIRGGYIKIQPDTYHPAMLRQLTRFMLQLDFDEERRAAAAGDAPKFRLLPVDLMIAVDAMQSLNGVARPFAAWADLRDIRARGIRYDIPDVPEVAPTPIPTARFLHVGDGWDVSAPCADWTGLRDPMREALTEGSCCAPAIVTTSDGRAVLDLPTEQQFDVDAESAAFIVDFEVERLLAMHDAGNRPGSITAGYRWYLHFGCLTLSHSQKVEHDDIARRTAFKDRLGLTDAYDVRDVLARSVPPEALPGRAREAWGTHAIKQAQLALC